MRRIRSAGQGLAAFPGVEFRDSSPPGRAPRPLPAPPLRGSEHPPGETGRAGTGPGPCRPLVALPSAPSWSPAAPCPSLLQHRPCGNLNLLAGCPAGTGDSLLFQSLAGSDQPGRRGPRRLRVLPTSRIPRGVHQPKITHTAADTHTHTHTPFDSSLPRKVTVQKQHGRGNPTVKYDNQHYSANQVGNGFKDLDFSRSIFFFFKSCNKFPLCISRPNFKG